MLKELSKKDNSTLKLNGYNQTELNIIKNIEEEYPKHLKKYKDLPKEDLKKMGYTDDQIKLLRNYKGTEKETILLAATLHSKLTNRGIEYSNTEDKTNAKFRYRFDWHGVPLIKRQDIVALTWNDWNLIKSEEFALRYHHVDNPQRWRAGPPATFLENDGPSTFGAGYKFDMAVDNNYWYARTGVFDFEVYNHGKKNLSVYAEYGHTTYAIKPTFSIPGFLSIEFSNGVDTADSTRLDVEVP